MVFAVIYRTQPTPFIDEIFHIPQVQKYCSGLFNEVCFFAGANNNRMYFFQQFQKCLQV